MRDKPVHINPEIIGFYARHLNDFGDSSQGVGWKNDDAQEIRFNQLIKLIGDTSNFTLNDLGCGTGKFYKFLISNGYSPKLFNGYDILPEMIQQAAQSLMPDNRVNLYTIDSASKMIISDYSVASGIFNVKYEAREFEWLQHILSTIESMNARSTMGFAFNLLTKYSDKEFMQEYLYYADPMFLFDYCKKHFSRNVALLHDYDQYDFTIIVRKS